MPYYLKREGQVVGPYARAELKDMLKHGEIRGTIAAREDGDREWSTVEKCLRGENRRIVTARDFPASRRGPASARSGGSSLGLTAYRKFAAATHHAARSVAGIGSRRPSASVSRPPGDRPPPARPPVDYRGDLLHGAFWTTGGILALILSFVFTSGTLAGGLYGIFGVVLALGLFFFLRGLCRLMTNR